MSTVIQRQGEPEVAAQIIAQSIVKIADATKAMYASGLNERAIILLISTASGVGKREVGLVLGAMSRLKQEFLTQPKK